MRMNIVRYFFLITLFVSSFIRTGTQILAQDQPMNLEADVEISVDTDKGTESGILTIDCFGTGPYLYMLYDKPPWENGRIIAEDEDIDDSRFEIKDLPSGDYYLMLQDADKRIFATSIRIDF